MESTFPWVSPTWLLIYIGFHILSYHYLINIRNRYIIKADKTIGKKFAAFELQKVENWSIVKQFPFYITFWPRFLAIISIVTIETLLIYILMIGQKSGSPILRVRRLLIKHIGRIIPRTCMFLLGFFWI
jgi:hypothetical protein